MNIAINNNIYNQAQLYMQEQGQSLSKVVEDFLSHLIANGKKKEQAQVPDIVLSLLGAGEPVDDDDLNGRKAYYQHLKEKYK